MWRDEFRSGERGKRIRLAQEAPEIVLLPLDGALVKAEASLALEEFIVMDDATPGAVVSVRNKRVQHLVEDHVLHVPTRNKFAIEQRMNPDNPIIFLNAAEDDHRCGFLATLLSPRDRVLAQTIAEVLTIYFVEDAPQFEVLSLGIKLELSLHIRGRDCGVSLRWLALRCGLFLLCAFALHACGNKRRCRIPAGKRYIREGEFLFFNAQSLLYYRDPLFELADLANVDDLLLPLRGWNCRESNH